MKKIISFLFFLSLFSYCISFSQWVQQNSGTTSNLTSIRFVNNYTGWVIGGNGTILKTTNEGANWISQSSGTTNSLLSFYSINGVNIWVVGTNGIILKSTNSGINWVSKSSGTSNYLRSVFFLNPSLGWVAGDADMLKTTNGGENWFSQSVGLIFPVRSIYFFNESTGVVAGGSTINKSTNGASSWSSIQMYQLLFLNSLSFANISTGFTVGTLTYPNPRYGDAYKTTNNGINWNHVITPAGDGEYYSVFFIVSSSGWISGFQGLIIKTENGGTNWYHQLSGTSNHLLSIYFVNTMTGWISGSAGTILKTTNGGGPVGITQIGTEIPQSPSLSQNYPNPFNPVTKIKYDIPPSKGARGMMTKLIIYDILGREIETLVNNTQKPGSYEVTWDGSRYASGVYFYRLLTDEYVETKKMVLIK